jgi:hypothetical protein
MKLLRQAIKNRRHGLRAVHAIRAALLDREVSKLKRRTK